MCTRLSGTSIGVVFNGCFLSQAASGFMLILCCSNGRILFASDTLQDVLGQAPVSSACSGIKYNL